MPDVEVGYSQVSQVALVDTLGKLFVGPDAYCPVVPMLNAIELSMVEVEPLSVATANKLPETRDPTKAKEANPPKTTAFLPFVIFNEISLRCLGRNRFALNAGPGSTKPRSSCFVLCKKLVTRYSFYLVIARHQKSKFS
jgi:hypothetical protein